MHFANKVLNHRLGHFEVSNHTVPKRPDGGDVAGRAAKHLLCLIADRQNLLASPDHLYRNYRGLIKDDSLVAYIYESVGSA